VQQQGAFHPHDHFLTDTTKDEKWLVLVERPSLAASRWQALIPSCNQKSIYGSRRV
jgi:hypothetical protein